MRLRALFLGDGAVAIDILLERDGDAAKFARAPRRDRRARDGGGERLASAVFTWLRGRGRALRALLAILGSDGGLTPFAAIDGGRSILVLGDRAGLLRGVGRFRRGRR